MRTRNIQRVHDVSCRLCGHIPERFSHLAQCPLVRQVFQYLLDHASHFVKGLTLDDRFIFLGLTSTGPLPSSLSALHIILWKFVVIAFTRKDTANEEFKPKRIWRDAIRRFEVRLLAYSEHIRLWHIQLNTPTIPPRARDRHAAILGPSALIDDEGLVTWAPHTATLFILAKGCRN